MCTFIEGTPQFENRKGIVHIIDRYGERAMSLGDFVISTRVASKLARQWVAEANESDRVRTFTEVKG